VTFYRTGGKRVLDVTLAGGLLLATAPLQLGIALVTRVVQGPPVLFRQERAGLHGAPFKLYKFRTMKPGTQPAAERVTPLGRLLRKSSLDELPQLFNILAGNMSFVGPRPLHMRYNSRYDERQRRRLEVRPGLTGLAQIHGRNLVAWSERFEWDVRYVEHVTLLGDLHIMARTAGVVLRGVSSSRDIATLPSHEFVGRQSDGGSA
jgi:lipopolysaccharide/colanic/teichoic acid biosynthesis glycosyltransferase